MLKHLKVVILGLTNSGKSTTATHLQKKGWPILEVDDEAQKMNGGVWPESEATLDILFKEINEKVLKLDTVVFVTSFLDVADVERFHEAGFTFIEIHASYDELVRRRIQRDGIPSDNWERFNRNYQNQQNIMPKIKPYLQLSIDTTDVKSEAVAEMIEQNVKRRS